MDGITDLMYVSLSELRKLVVDRKAWRAEILGVAESDMTEQLNQTEDILIVTEMLTWSGGTSTVKALGPLCHCWD